MSLSEVLLSSRLTLPSNAYSDVLVPSWLVNQVIEVASNATPLINTLPVQINEIRAQMLELMQLQALESFKLSMSTPAFAHALDQMRDHIAAHGGFERVVIGTSLVFSSGLSVGYVLWLIRGSALLGSLLTSLPAWTILDPVPVLAFYQRKKRDDNDDDDLSERMFAKQRTAKKPALPASVAGGPVSPVASETAPLSEQPHAASASSPLRQE